jgi:hypothetical protein
MIFENIKKEKAKERVEKMHKEDKQGLESLYNTIKSKIVYFRDIFTQDRNQR